MRPTIWRLLFRLACNISVWSFFAALIGHHIGSHSGYAQGVRDAGALVMSLRDGAVVPPAPFTKGGI